jgi:hypothetical protein
MQVLKDCSEKISKTARIKKKEPSKREKFIIGKHGVIEVTLRHKLSRHQSMPKNHS